MKNKVITIFMIMIIGMFLGMTNAYAAGATLNVNTTNVKPGDTFELNIALSSESTAYEINLSNDNSNLIESSELVSKIGEGNTSKIYLVQLKAESERQVYSIGTKIATIKYKVSNNAKVGDKITIKANGDVVGKTSADKNTMNESITINIVAPEENKPTQEDKKDTEQPKQEQSQQQEQPKQEQTKQQTQTTQQQQSQSQTTTTTKNTTKKASTLPKTGAMDKTIILLSVAIILIAQLILAIRYVKMK